MEERPAAGGQAGLLGGEADRRRPQARTGGGGGVGAEVRFEDWERERVQRAVGVVATLDADGTPRAVAVLVSIEGDGLRFEADPTSRKFRNLSRDPRVAVCVQGPPKWGVSVQGRARILDAGGDGGQAQILVVPDTKVSWRRKEG